MYLKQLMKIVLPIRTRGLTCGLETGTETKSETGQKRKTLRNLTLFRRLPQ